MQNKREYFQSLSPLARCQFIRFVAFYGSTEVASVLNPDNLFDTSQK